MATSPDLIERFDGFAYDYRMRCGCGGAVSVTAETHYREPNGARVPCGHCGGEVHFGPAVALVRDERDPALDDGAVSRFAWYHTSTQSDWPSPGHRATVEQLFRNVDHRLIGDADDVAAAIEDQATRALHVGTYEASIENMLRRMRDQADESSQFFLYRVAVRIDPGRINEDYRDENDEKAAQLGISDLDAADLDAVRYLNVREATGSLSLAVRPACIAAVQCLPIPVDELARTPSAGLSARLDELEAAQAELARVEATLPKLDTLRLLRMRNGSLPDPDGVAQRIEEARDRGHAIWRDLDALLTEHFLDGVSPVVADKVQSVVSAWRRKADDGIGSYSARFAQMAALLTRPHEVVQLVARQPWRDVADS